MTASIISSPARTRKSLGLDDLLIELYCLLDDLLPVQQLGRPRSVSNPELICLAVAQMLLDCPRERAWLRRAPARLGHLFPRLISREQYNRRLRSLGPEIARAIRLLGELHPDAASAFLLADTTPVPAGMSIATMHRSELAGSAALGYSSSHSRYYWGYKLLIITGPEGMPLGFDLVPANTSDQTALREVLPDIDLTGRTLLADRGFRGTEPDVAAAGGRLIRPLFSTEKHQGQKTPRVVSRVRQWIESVFWTLKGSLSLERHGARTISGLATRIGSRLLALAAALWFNTLTGNPGRHLVAYDY